MRRVAMMTALALLLVPALAKADILNRTKLGKSAQDMSLRAKIADQLNKNKQVKPINGAFKALGVTGTKSMHAGPRYSRISIQYQAQPDVTIGGTIMPLGGCFGHATALQYRTGTIRVYKPHVDGLLRSGPPVPAPTQARR